MKGIRFYEEFRNTGKTVPKGTVLAVAPENVCPDYSMEALGAVFSEPNSPVASTSVSREYLATRCKQVSEARARRIHPELFKRLDAE